MDKAKDEFHPYINQVNAELRKFYPTMHEPMQEDIKSPSGLWEWQKEATRLWQAFHTLDKRIAVVEQKRSKPQRPVISSSGQHKGYLHSDGKIHPYPEDC